MPDIDAGIETLLHTLSQMLGPMAMSVKALQHSTETHSADSDALPSFPGTVPLYDTDHHTCSVIPVCRQEA